MNNNMENNQFNNVNNGMNNASINTNNGQPIMNNVQVSNQPNQISNGQIQPNNQNIYNNQNGNSNAQMANNIKNKKTIPTFVKVIIGIVVAIIVISLISKLFKGSKKSEFGLSNVDYICTYEKNKDDVKLKATTEIVFEDNGYETSIYNKFVYTYDKLTDEKVLEKLKELDRGSALTSTQADYDVNGTTKLGTTDIGYDTVATRKGNTLTITSTNFNYNGYEKLDSSTKKEFKKTYEEIGYTCK